ncbi:MAG: tRNA pseudouridine(55) synthase TruB [Burkholderiales bacterium]|nr:tRNA pseudouridine(55) synthase TruB [Burkholderiales bacterium]
MSGARDGVLLLDKPVGITSNAALQEAKRLLAARRAGHGGTLDPLASGLLVILFGEATKFARFALESDKTYLAALRLGVATATGDAEGEVIARRPVHADRAAVEAALEGFRGDIAQVPPIYSALKRSGRPLYALARAGERVARPPRRVRVSELVLLSYEGDLLQLRIRCSKGTYVRQLAADLGEALGCGAHLAALRRLAAGRFRLEDAIGLEALRALPIDARVARLIPPARLLEGLPAVRLDGERARRFCHGQPVRAAPAARGECRVLAPDGALLGVGTLGADGLLHPARLVARAASAIATD